MRWMADFETTTDENDCRVWAVAWVNIDSVMLPNYGNTLQISNNLESFMNYLDSQIGSHDCYFHNLKFDGSFIIDYLLRQGYVYDEELKDEKTFKTMITDMKIFYQIQVRMSDKPERTKTGLIKQRKGKPVMKSTVITFKDSLKKIPLPVKAIAKAYQIEEQKTEIDYEMVRPVGYELTEIEKEYVSNDVIIVAKALYIMINEQGQTSLTMSSDAMADFKHRFAHVPRGTSSDKKRAEDHFRKYFPLLPIEMDDYIRKAYKGGYTYANPKFQMQVVGEGLVYDVNSLYPSRMRDCLLPYGKPVFKKGQLNETKRYPLFIQRLKCSFQLKENRLPMIQLKNNSRYSKTEYLTHSEGIEELTLTSVDLALFFEQYEVSNLEYLDGFYFKAHKGFFEEYIAYWGKIKKESTGGLRQLAKLMLNSLYGKFASSTSGTMKQPYLDEEGNVKYESVEHDEREPVYTALACFVTAWSRDLMIRSAQATYDRFLYCDTDSLHVLGLEEPNIQIDDKELGFWKCEGQFSQAKYLRAKTYLETFEWGTEVKCAGMPENVKKEVTYENFEVGASYGGKLMPKTVKGGIVLVKKDFTIQH